MNPSVDPQRLLQGTYFCRAAYDGPNIREGHTQGIATYEPQGNRVVLACAGSNDRRDWWANFDFMRRHEVAPGAWVARGFYNHTILWLTAVDRWFREHPEIPDDARVLMFGHSAGAAVTVLASFLDPRLERMGNEAIVYACPRIGNTAWVNAYANRVRTRVLRVEADGDPVCSLPPFSLFYRHVGLAYRVPGGKGAEHPIDAYTAAVMDSIQKS